MKNLCEFIYVIGIVTVSALPKEPSSDIPILKQFEVDEYNNVIRPYDRVNGKRSEIIVEQIANLRLECHANYPVQWIYTGSGVC